MSECWDDSLVGVTGRFIGLYQPGRWGSALDKATLHCHPDYLYRGSIQSLSFQTTAGDHDEEDSCPASSRAYEAGKTTHPNCNAATAASITIDSQSGWPAAFNPFPQTIKNDQPIALALAAQRLVRWRLILIMTKDSLYPKVQSALQQVTARKGSLIEVIPA
ncbi:hypothetical protein PGTUg99_026167 [Puccinia graminis f. sp. tritici]|uniref:Uncharacterized protein n=1 Tax=Puccinia graminis f. sp. tritici TaxID=56615 RepID=A0A5B0NJ74_PUCGR|nr:hypothetical protein PGTUg99_026167 [Puccinia graminis f. sp. tritici]